MEVETPSKRRGIISQVSKFLKFLTGLGALALIVMTGFLIGGFLKFTDTVASYNTDAMPDKSAAIVVYTGGSSRIEEAARLLKEGKGKRLLISGVHPKTSREALMLRSGLEPELFKCCVDIDHQAPDTHGNAVETGKWSAANGFKSLIIVTSTYHMPRSILETNRMLPDVKLIPFAVAADEFDSDRWYSDRNTLRLLLSEYSKYIATQIRPALTGKTLNTIRASLNGY